MAIDPPNAPLCPPHHRSLQSILFASIYRLSVAARDVRILKLLRYNTMAGGEQLLARRNCLEHSIQLDSPLTSRVGKGAERERASTDLDMEWRSFPGLETSVNPFRDKLLQPAPSDQRQPTSKQNLHNHDGATAHQTSDTRQFELQSIVSRNKQRFGSEALFRTGSEDLFVGGLNNAPRIMLDNWLLYGFEELIGGRAVFLHCTRETLLSGFLSLLPRSAVFEIQESIKPDDEVLSACRSLKAAGYRFALD